MYLDYFVSDLPGRSASVADSRYCRNDQCDCRWQEESTDCHAAEYSKYGRNDCGEDCCRSLEPCSPGHHSQESHEERDRQRNVDARPIHLCQGCLTGRHAAAVQPCCLCRIEWEAKQDHISERRPTERKPLSSSGDLH